MDKIKTAALGIITGLANGLFGSGGGTIVVPGMERFLGVDAHKAHATAIAVILPLTIISMFVYMGKTEIDYKAVIYISAGGVVGGYIGAKFLNKLSGKALHKIFGVFMIAAAIRMIL